MGISLKSSVFATTLASLILVSQVGSFAWAQEGRLTIPSTASQPVELSLAEANLSHESVDPSELMQVYVGKAVDWTKDKAAINGRYSADYQFVKFKPQFDFVEGQDYVIRVRRPGERNEFFHELTPFNIRPTRPVVNPEVTAVYPSADVLPENVLRFYIRFSTPMKPHVAFDYIKLVDEVGNIDDAAFMKFKQELWSEDRKRLTVLFDPGRIKRKVSTNLTLGPALTKGKCYELIVKGGWPTAIGTKPLARFSKSFSVTDALRDLPNSKDWEISTPALNTTDALKIEFDRPFDHQLLHKDITVISADGENIVGNVITGNDETEWQFQPKEPWVNRQIYIVVDSEFEDIAGNNFQDLLDHAVETETKITPSSVFVPVDLMLTTK